MIQKITCLSSGQALCIANELAVIIICALLHAPQSCFLYSQISFTQIINIQSEYDNKHTDRYQGVGDAIKIMNELDNRCL